MDIPEGYESSQTVTRCISEACCNDTDLDLQLQHAKFTNTFTCRAKVYCNTELIKSLTDSHILFPTPRNLSVYLYKAFKLRSVLSS